MKTHIENRRTGRSFCGREMPAGHDPWTSQYESCERCVRIKGAQDDAYHGLSRRPTPTKGGTEWVAVLHGNHGTVKIAYRSPAHLARGLQEQTSEGWVAARVYERERSTYADDESAKVEP